MTAYPDAVPLEEAPLLSPYSIS